MDLTNPNVKPASDAVWVARQGRWMQERNRGPVACFACHKPTWSPDAICPEHPSAPQAVQRIARAVVGTERTEDGLRKAPRPVRWGVRFIVVAAVGMIASLDVPSPV